MIINIMDTQNETLEQWFARTKLSRRDLLNLAFVARRSFEDIQKGIRRLPSLYRLYLVTGLKEFELSHEEEVKYEEMKMETPTTKLDEIICAYFAKNWKENSTLPKEEDLLWVSARERRDKKVLQGEIIKRYFGSNSSSHVQTAKKATTTSKEVSITEVSNALPAVIYEIEEVLEGNAELIEAYRKKNGKFLKNLKTYLNILFVESPSQVKADYENFKKTEKNFA